MLRLDAEKFGTAEYYEATRDGERPRIRRRLAWYGLGFGIAVAILFIHPTPQGDLYLGSGDRLGAVLGGLAYGLLGIARGGRLRDVPLPPDPLPGRVVVPGGAAQLDRDRVHRRGRVPRRAARPAADRRRQPDAREPRPGPDLHADDPARRARPRPLPAGPDARDRAPRRLADGRHRRHRGGVPRPRDHPRSRSSCAPAIPARPSRAAARSRRSRSAAGRPRAGGSSARGSRPRGIGDAIGGRRVAAGRALRPRPVLRLALSVLRLRGLRRGRGARAEGAGRGVRRGAARSSWTLRADALDAAFGTEPAAARDASISVAARRRCSRPRRSPGCSTSSGRATASPTTPRSRSRRTRAPTSAATPGRFGPPA